MGIDREDWVSEQLGKTLSHKYLLFLEVLRVKSCYAHVKLDSGWLYIQTKP